MKDGEIQFYIKTEFIQNTLSKVAALSSGKTFLSVQAYMIYKDMQTKYYFRTVT